jgi:signal transduction histidine kinase
MSSLEQLMLDQSQDIMLLVEPKELRIVMANRTASQKLGYAVENLCSMAITDIESSLQDIFYWEDVRNGQFQDIEKQEGLYQCADASLLTVIKSIRIVAHEGASLLVILARDVRQERQVEEALERTLSQLRATLESTGNGVLVIDWQGKIVSMNRQFSTMWSIPETLLLDRDDAAIIELLTTQLQTPEIARMRLQAIVDSLETEDIFELKDGRVFECKSRPQYLGESIVGRVFGFNDITARTLAEAALRESRDHLEKGVRERTAELQAANASLQAEKLHQQELIKKLEEAQNQLLQSEKMASMGQLAAGVAHEINNPVGFVNSNLGTLERYVDNLLRLLDAYEKLEPSLDENTLQDLRQLKKEIDTAYLRQDISDLLAESLEGMQRVKRIVQDLKDFSHVDRAELEWADLEKGLESTLNVVWNELKYKARVIKEYTHPPAIECLPSQLNQVFMNLLINATHSIETTGEITLRTGFDQENVWVEVEDTGNGIPAENLTRIFEPFFTTKPVGKGTGLGLSLSYGIVKKHHGKIEVASEVGKGTKFKVILPRTIEAPASDA